MSKQKEITGPGISSVIIIGILSFLLGGTLGLASLITEDVPVMSRAPDPEAFEPGDVYYLRGDRIGRTAWRAKEDAWRAGTVDVLRLSEAELNQWSQERMKMDKPVDSGSEEAPSGFRDKLAVELTPVNFKIFEDRVQLATEVSMGGLLDDRTFIYQVSGNFASTPGGIRFVPQRGTLGNAPLGSVPLLREWLFGSLVNRFENGTDLGWLEEALEAVETVEITDGQLVLRRHSDS